MKIITAYIISFAVCASVYAEELQITAAVRKRRNIAANNAFEAIGTKACLSLNADVGAKKMEIT